MTVIRMAEFRTEPLSVDEVRLAVADPGAGAIALFLGTVRDHDHGRAVSALSYSAHPSGADQLRQVAEKVAARFGVRALAAVHRTGDLDIGDLAVVVAAAADHRDEAFAACRALIEDLKQLVPVWKRQLFAAGESEWVNSA
ncbi:MAG: molybdenum cofactor biosynthesis protein MoaE [Streptosporangiaceae bacterium]